MEYLVLALTLFGFIVLVMLKGLYDEKMKRKQFIRRLRNHYGELPQRDPYKPEDFERISHYFRQHEAEGFHIDDITWNDLNMDRIFEQMNYTYSAAGEEYLYWLLRTPAQEGTELDGLEEHICFFMGHAEERIRFQTLFAELGKTGKYSIYDYLNYLDLLGERSNRIHYICDGILLFALVMLFVSAPVAVLLLISGLCYNIVTYFREKNDIDPYITSFGYILRLIGSAEKMTKLSAGPLSGQMEELKECRKKLNRFRSGSYIIMSSSRMNASGNPLELLMDYLRMALHLDLIKFNQMLSEVRKNIDVIDRMLTVSGYVEAVIAIGAYRAGLDSFCIPEFADGEELAVENMYHPLIGEPVKNSISTRKGVLLTGSNASGKSTFLKTVAVNAILAQTIHTCAADRYRGGRYRIMTSMALRDDLSGGDSYYIVEIKSLKRILNEAARPGQPILCFVDEVLRGTNTVERIAASTQILKSLSGKTVLCFAATHDIELTGLLAKYYNNYHFEEEIIDNDVVFNYRLMKGKATTRNAIRLLGVMGYQEEIIGEAEKLAAHFLESGTWT